MRKILLVGCSGFIGSKLCGYYLEKGWEVHGVGIQASFEAFPDVCYSQFENNDNFWINLMQAKFDVCINSAGSANVSVSFSNPYIDYHLNTRLVFDILNGIKHANPSTKFVNLSSAAIYGNPEVLPIEESHHANPISPYGHHKLMAEQICREFTELFGVSTVCARIFSAYGPGIKKQLFWDLFQKSQSQDSIELFGTGEETRDFIYIDDLADALYLLTTKECPLIVNLANGKQIPIREVARIFFEAYTEVFEKNMAFTFGGQDKLGDPKCWEADIKKLHSLGYAGSVEMKEGLTNYLKWIQADAKV